MDFSKIIEYQKKDNEIIKLDRKLNDSENKKNLQKMLSTVKNAHAKTQELEHKAGENLREHESLKVVYENTNKSLNAVSVQVKDDSTAEELENIQKLLNKILNNLNILEKKLTQNAESSNNILSEFDKAKKLYSAARERYTVYKEAYEKEEAEVAPAIKKIEADLKILEKEIEPKFMERYKKLRQDKIFPAFVPLVNGNSCGGCHMEMPSSMVSKIKENGILECENCRRIIYVAGAPKK